ncbi:MAG: 4a-hydroxytetrahydrobiopterin dehydratase [Thermoanaerobaculia bacterium]
MGHRLTGAQIRERVNALPDWQAVDREQAIRRTFELPGFRAAIAFVAYVAELAEAHDHHPDIDIRYDKVTLTLSTHSAGGLTDQDFRLASRIYA